MKVVERIAGKPEFGEDDEIGAFIGGLILSGGSINSAPLTLTSFIVSLLGAIVLLAIVNLVRRGSVR